jgi:anhydro-N-acetylmuramic acid kinase
MSIVLGIMSGTSIDGVDYALCQIAERCVKLRQHWHVPFPTGLRQRLQLAAANRSTTYDLGRLHHELGRFYAKGARRLKNANPLACAGLHGQTVFHDANAPATLQIGEPAWLAAELSVPVVNNFRPADIAAGGQGAPLATIFHEWVFAGRGRHVCVNNLGGISNVTSLDWRRSNQPRIKAFDTGPANMLMDMAVMRLTGGRQSCDSDGKWASRGTPQEALLAKWLKHPFFRQKPPKSTGRELFGEVFLERVFREAKGLSRIDLLATLTEFTARSIALNYSLHLPDTPERVVLCGGGASNPAFVEAIRRNVPCEVINCESLGWPAQAIEPAAFALLAWLRMNGLPGNIPDTTGAKSPVMLGQIAQLHR